MRVLVLGGYGFIGLEVVRRLLAEGVDVVGLARSERRGRSLEPRAEWIGADIGELIDPARWAPMLAGIDAVVNASGLLQTGLADRVARVQRDAVVALIAACESEGTYRFVQISAPGAQADADTAFMRTKAAADAALAASGLNWVTLRPGLVVGRAAYGGTALVRMLAAVPWAQPIAFPDAPVQTVALEDVAAAVARALRDDTLTGDFDLVEDDPRPLSALVEDVRAWLGFAPARANVPAPPALARAAGRLGDAAGWLGWRPALRSTSLAVIRQGVRGDPQPWKRSGGDPLRPLEATLAAIPAHGQDRLHARAALVFPILLASLSGFWIASGVIGLARIDAAAALVSGALGAETARAAVIAGSAVDLLIGGALLIRRFMLPACLAAVIVSALHVIAGSALAPQLWADPLGPYVKIVPVIVLSLAAAVMAPRR